MPAEMKDTMTAPMTANTGDQPRFTASRPVA
jgi:hypothetical protein